MSQRPYGPRNQKHQHNGDYDDSRPKTYNPTHKPEPSAAMINALNESLRILISPDMATVDVDFSKRSEVIEAILAKMMRAAKADLQKSTPSQA